MIYQLTENSNIIKRLSDGAFIPTDPANFDYQAYLAWVDEGNVAAAYVAPALTWEQYQQQAKVLLDKVTGSSGTVIRCYIAGIPLPAEWQTYIADLRAIIKATSGDVTTALPIQPVYPAGS